ncbi:hypothetical protein EDB81DRAFT_904068 [Dactylonectria macrodidyma]|uniref:DUF7580 domain-containing protein n=1 Tax=Dactylonectria macrodidyma TaxID=307937 RepID=A0A9P9EAF7_9HYPO|nr:hypothetical protein EDB81DRAFT_904068 [Dactylonectria macrodidyma]
MSGFEVAGVVLGAFPIAITAVEQYRDVAKRLNLFYAVRPEYKRCRDQLAYYQILFKTHLRQLLLPLVVDDDKIEELLADPGGSGWKKKPLDDLLQKRMKDAYETYFEFVKEMGTIMCELNKELALDSEDVQSEINSPQLLRGNKRLSSAIRKEGRAFQSYRAKFSNRESVRERLFSDFQSYNEKLKKLLDCSDEDTRLVQQRDVMMKKSESNLALCTFWKQATKLFSALSSVWNCRCQASHGAELTLQHRTTQKAEFHVTFITSDSSRWDICSTRISDGDEIVAAQLQETIQILERVPFVQANHRNLVPAKSALKSTSTSTCVQIVKQTPSITLTCNQPTTEQSITQEIPILCTALNQTQDSCCGYLREDECRFYVYVLSRHNTHASPPSVTLDQILRGDGFPRPTRTQRYGLALTLTSSFLQLLDSQWLPTPLQKTDIFFKSDPSDSGLFRLDEPRVHRQFKSRVDEPASGKSARVCEYPESLDRLGIMLLELCFGMALEDQPCRKDWPDGSTAKEVAAYDLMAAREWQCQIVEEAGSDYAGARRYCGKWSPKKD